MSSSTADLSSMARQAVAANDWQRVLACATEIARQSPGDPESAFLLGLAQKSQKQLKAAERSFLTALERDADRYDAAVELADVYVQTNRYALGHGLLDGHADKLTNSPLYLHMAAQCYMAMNLHELAWPLIKQAAALQPEIDGFQASMATCAVYLGDIAAARTCYKTLLSRSPGNQRFHFELSQLERASNDRHIKRMERLLKKADPTPSKNVWVYYALGKEYEDLGRWDEAFRYFRKGGNAVKSIAPYNVDEDVDLIDTIIETCNSGWLESAANDEANDRTPVFVVGLPRTGTTLTDRVLTSHSMVQGAGESQLLQMVLRDGRQAGTQIGMTPDLLRAAADREISSVGDAFMDAIQYRLGDQPWFVEQLPENVLYLGFIAKAWPNARIVHLRRNAMDACFAMYKQSYFRFAYSLDDLAAYYAAYDRLSRHWREMLGDRMLELQYEELVSDPESCIRSLLDSLGLPFEQACVDFEHNVSAVATASSAQVREKMHTRSVGRWKNFEKHLRPLFDELVQQGIDVDGGIA